MKRISFYILMISFFASCQEQSVNTITVNGTIKNAYKNKIALISFGATNAAIILDTTTVDSKGKFSLKTLTNGEELYAIKVDTMQEIWFVNDTKEITINADLKEYKNYKTIGSIASQALHSFISKFDSLLKIQNKIDINIDTLTKHLAKDSIINIAKQEKKSFKNVLRDYSSAAIYNTNNPALKYFYLYYVNKANSIDENDIYKMVESAYNQFPKHTQLLGLKNSLSDIVKSSPKLFLLNTNASDFSYVDTGSNKISLKSFAGKYLLLSFWESYNENFRSKTPVLTDIYSQFKNKDFEILGISLDSNKTAWQKAIKQDSLVWKQVQDTLGFKSDVVKKYFVKSLPYNVLINSSGKIIAIDLSEDELREKLKELCK